MTDELLVFISRRFAGVLTQGEAGKPSFTYDSAYVRADGLRLSARMPLAESTYGPERVKPYLAGLLPENEAVRLRWARHAESAGPTRRVTARGNVRVDPNDAFTLLGFMGLDCPGAVQFVLPHEVELITDRHEEYEPCTESAIATRLRALADDEASWALEDEHWSLGGQQEKFALTYLNGQWHQARQAGATTHIIKPGIRRLHHQALVEHATQAAASDLGIPVAPSRFMAFEDQWAIVSTRYDRTTDGVSVERLHQEDFCQALGFLPARKYEDRNGPQLRSMGTLVDRWAADRSAARSALADYAIINVVAGAPDGHSKNISLLHADDGTQVAPLYDLATGLAYDKDTAERTSALPIGTERAFSRIYGHQWEGAAKALKLPGTAVKARVATLADGFPGAYLNALTALIDAGAPGAEQVLERSLGPVIRHCSGILDRL